MTACELGEFEYQERSDVFEVSDAVIVIRYGICEFNGSSDYVSALNFIIKKACDALEVGDVFQLRLSLPFDFGRETTIGWYWTNNFSDKSETDIPSSFDDATQIELFSYPDGCYVLGFMQVDNNG